MKLEDKDWDLIITSLEYTKKAFSEYTHYPSYEFKQERIADVESVIRKIKQGNKHE
jgi:hypothetical protein